MYLVYDINGVLAYLRRDAHLVNQRTDIIHRVIRRGIELVDIKRPLLIEGLTRLALITSVVAVLGIQTVNSLCEDTCASGFTHSSRTAKQVCMRQMVLTYRILKSCRQGLLPHDGLECLRSVFPR